MGDCHRRRILSIINRWDYHLLYWIRKYPGGLRAFLPPISAREITLFTKMDVALWVSDHENLLPIKDRQIKSLLHFVQVYTRANDSIIVRFANCWMEVSTCPGCRELTSDLLRRRLKSAGDYCQSWRRESSTCFGSWSQGTRDGLCWTTSIQRKEGRREMRSQ
jgi:hypothetical protein